MDYASIADGLVEELGALRFARPVTHVYNPLEYAREPFMQYLERYGRRSCDVVLLGMNPGPWGMAQTGVPFGAVEMVRGWLRIEAPVRRPKREHPKRPVRGFSCPRNEVSGMRLWGWARDTFGSPERFFRRFFVYNYCPLMFLEESGRNRTPDKLPARARRPLFDACDRALRGLIEHLRPQCVLGVGVFAEARAKESLAGLDVAFGRILHPSPANPAANRGWASRVTAQLLSYGIRVGSGDRGVR
jgi:single-strand selective monofunctional uracil DNA glycosylase